MDLSELLARIPDLKGEALHLIDKCLRSPTRSSVVFASRLTGDSTPSVQSGFRTSYRTGSSVRVPISSRSTIARGQGIRDIAIEEASTSRIPPWTTIDRRPIVRDRLPPTRPAWFDRRSPGTSTGDRAPLVPSKTPSRIDHIRTWRYRLTGSGSRITPTKGITFIMQLKKSDHRR